MLAPWAILALVLGVVAFFVAPQGPWKTAVGVAGAAWIFFGTARFAWTRLKGSGRFTPEMLGMTLAHTGIAVFVAGALLVEAQNLQTELAVKPGQTVELGGYDFRFEGVEEPRGPKYNSDPGQIGRAHV